MTARRIGLDSKEIDSLNIEEVADRVIKGIQAGITNYCEILENAVNIVINSEG